MIRFEDNPGSACAVSMSSTSGQAVTKSHHFPVKVHPKSDRDLPTRLRAFLRAAHPTKTAESVAVVTGLSANTVSSWLKGVSAPSFAAYTTLIDVYGAELLAAVVPNRAEWLSNAAREAERNRLASDMKSLKARMEALS